MRVGKFVEVHIEGPIQHVLQYLGPLQVITLDVLTLFAREAFVERNNQQAAIE